MKTNVKQILSSILGITITIFTIVFSFIFLLPLFFFLIICFIIFVFLLRRKIIKQKPEFFKNAKMKKGRVIDQEDIVSR